MEGLVSTGPTPCSFTNNKSIHNLMYLREARTQSLQRKHCMLISVRFGVFSPRSLVASVFVNVASLAIIVLLHAKLRLKCFCYKNKTKNHLIFSFKTLCIIKKRIINTLASIFTPIIKQGFFVSPIGIAYWGCYPYVCIVK